MPPVAEEEAQADDPSKAQLRWKSESLTTSPRSHSRVYGEPHNASHRTYDRRSSPPRSRAKESPSRQQPPSPRMTRAERQALETELMNSAMPGPPSPPAAAVVAPEESVGGSDLAHQLANEKTEHEGTRMKLQAVLNEMDKLHEAMELRVTAHEATKRRCAEQEEPPSLCSPCPLLITCTAGAYS